MDALPEGWLQFLFVAVPVLSLIGTWMGLRTAGRIVERRERARRVGQHPGSGDTCD
ncbi:MAG TPA: hypothetical protein PLN96_06245 [Zoogloea sp.]|uniref:hypothetical protein n=1 Tax=Zoogloea sp. TaxID=49181 RepID=UPI002B93BF6E|nr:hypothetical protein [Zoogloea sp.]HMV16460.1 hypothetical protein [Rhodocyclaceae bacterium]HMV62854.1 hypothetical protein [Rhodocyclaceae bacterium]HMW50846.1 hypothetical protein [Rhodocyclaceae bacterium]HMY48317.1 hypothetical protein [Rhodocyclaceae bacterium]HMZ75300.1 hypothetical protein [Rhodocyclaceae bacterium]